MAPRSAHPAQKKNLRVFFHWQTLKPATVALQNRACERARRFAFAVGRSPPLFLKSSIASLLTPAQFARAARALPGAAARRRPRAGESRHHDRRARALVLALRSALLRRDDDDSIRAVDAIDGRFGTLQYPD